MKWNHYLLLPVLACCPMAEGCVFIGADSPRPNIPSIARHHSKWTADIDKSLCADGDLNGRSVRNLGISIGGIESRTSDESPYPIYSIYEVYETKTPPVGGGITPQVQNIITNLNRYDFYTDENEIVVKCIPHRSELGRKLVTVGN